MNKLIIRAVATGAVALSVGAPAVLADSASIGTTGPGSNNTITSSNLNSWNQNTSNQVQSGNFNNQWATSGNSRVAGNTAVWGGGSGNAANYNTGQNNVFIGNSGSGSGWSGSGGNGGATASIWLTGPGSNNQIRSNNQNRFNQTTTNNVSANNTSSQSARSGGVTITGNTLVDGAGGSGDAINANSGTNNVEIDNSGMTMPAGFGSNNGGGSASIGITGPHSNNQILSSDGTNVNNTTINDVSATNSNQQSANTGSSKISGNTVVSGGGGSGSAFNSNMGENDVGLSN